MGDIASGGRGRATRLLLATFGLIVAWPLGLVAAADQSLTGVIAIDHADNFAQHREESYPMLELGSGERLELQGVSVDQVVPGARVSVRGWRQGSSVYVERGGIREAGSGSVLAASTTTATMGKRVAVLMVNFVDPTPSPSPTPSPTVPPTDSPSAPPPTDPVTPDPLQPTPSAVPSDAVIPTDTPLPTNSPTPTATPSPSPIAPPSPTPSPSPTSPPQPWTADFLRGVYFNNTRSVADYYREVSNGQMSLTGDVFGWFTVPADTSACNHLDWGNAARAAATSSGVDLSAYTNVAVVFPRQSACWWVGMAQLPGRNTYINGSADWTAATWLFTPTHELGHNYGMNHASTLSCTNAGLRVAFSDSCTLDEYGDPYDTMGGNGQRHFNTWHRWQIGLLGAADVQTITATGTYTIAPAEAAGGVPRVVRIARPAGNYFYLEYRQPYGRYDNFSATAAVVNGVSIRLAAGVGSQTFSKLLDTNPQTGTFFDSALTVGRGFADNLSNIYVVTQAVSPSGATVFVQIGPDTTPPTNLVNLGATIDSQGAVALSWTAAADDLFVATYQVSRDGVIVGSAYGTSYADPNPPQAATHTYSVSAIDGAGNIGPAAVTAPIFVADTTKPGSAGSLSATAIGAHSVVVAWAAARDNVGVTGYQVSRNGSLLATVTGTTLTDDAAPDGAGLTYQVRAVDAAGNVGPAASAAVSLTDVTPPTLDGELSLSVTVEGTINVAWPIGADNVGVTGYRISRDGVALTDITGTSYADVGRSQARSYDYAVVALDATGNASGALSGTVYLPDTVAPAAPPSVSATQSGPRSVDLAWAAAADNVGVDHYLVTVDGAALATTADLHVLGISVADGADHQFTVAAVDAAGNVGQPAAAGIEMPDVTPPGAVQTFGAAQNGTTVALAWTAAADNVGVTGYRIERDGLPLADLDGAARAYTDTAVASGQHSYTVAAVDAAGNLGQSVAATVTLVDVDTVAPSVPLSLKAIALSGRRVSLSWSASTDDRPGVISYRVFRGRKRIAVVTTLAYTDRPALVGIYTYRVRAVDAAGNVSQFSVRVSVLTKP